MSSAHPPDERWIPVALGAIDVRSSSDFALEAEVLVIPVVPGPALCLVGEGAALWRELVRDGPLLPNTVDAARNTLLEDLREAGLVVRTSEHPAAVTHLAAPSLSSSLHELVYALVQRVADGAGIRCFFIKGPALHLQGLREREHSGDVDVWCDPARWDDLAEALEPWGWVRQPDPWRGTSIHHTATMTPTSWGCEIDVHRRLPGLTLDDRDAFAAVFARTTLLRYAGVEVAVPEVATHAVLAAVHAVRPEIGAGRRTEGVSAVATALLSATPDPASRARDVGAAAVLRGELTAVTGALVDVPEDAEPVDWEWRARPDRVRAYWTALQTLPLLTRVRVACRLVWPDDDVALASERRAGLPETSPRAARRKRLVRALRTWMRDRLQG